ncbi:hypothetical protein M8J77_015309 [Diaphorina citri]|nr:hypothetical protein M8J77_015309 [Diaphorina citri]
MNTINIYSVYNSKKLKFPDLDKVFMNENTNVPTIAAGDLNAKHRIWNPYRENTNGKILTRYTNSRNIVIHATEEPTRISEIPNIASSIIDLILTKNISQETNITTTEELSSDHNPVIFSLNNDVEIISPIFLNYDKADLNKFEDYLNYYTPTYEDIPITPPNIEKEIDNLTKHIQKATELSIPKKQAVTSKLELPDNIKHLINTRNKARQRWQQYRNLEYRKIKNKLSKRIQYEVQRLKDKIYEEKIRKLDNTDNTLWKNLNRFKRKITNIPFIVDSDGTKITNDTDIVNCIAKTYQLNYKGNTELGHPSIEDKVKTAIETLNEAKIPDNEKITLTNKKEILEAIKTMKNKKAPGEDNIQPLILKKLPNNILEIIVDIFNSCIEHSYFPICWKNTIILPIIKPNKPKTDPLSYRPIGLLNTISKVFEQILLNRINSTNIQITQHEQCGFKKHLSTTHQLTKIVQDISYGLTKNKSTLMVLLDIEKAFDRIWHDGLIYKLIQLKLPLHLIKIIQSYLQHRTFQVKHKNILSNTFTSDCGVVQGSKIGPVLFNAYINDLPKLKYFKTGLYADDTAFYRTGNLSNKEIKLLQKELDKTAKYYNDWKIKINSSKTEGIIFSMRHNQKTKDITYNGKKINWTNKVKYLGIYLDRKINWGPQLKYMKDKVNAAIAKLYYIINNKSKLKPNLKILLYKTIIRPLMSYATPCWQNLTKTKKKSLQTLQNKVLRKIYTNKYSQRVKNSKLHNMANLEYLQDFHSKLIKNFNNSLNSCQNPILNQIGKYDNTYIGKRNRHKLIPMRTPPPT